MSERPQLVAPPPCPPVSNTGGKGKPEHEMFNSGEGRPAATLIDHLGVTFKDWAIARALVEITGKPDSLGTEYVNSYRIEVFMKWLLGGTGLIVVPNCAVASGVNHYENRIFLQDASGVRMGHVLWGGENQRGTVNLNLTGQCCSCISETSSWTTLRSRLESVLNGYKVTKSTDPKFTQTDGLKISRVDVAWDDIDGVYSVDRVADMYDNKEFVNGGRPPTCSCAGDWRNNQERTFYVGRREGAVYWRSYEKGHKMGDLDSSWVRHEVEFKAKYWAKGIKGFTFPLSVITNPDGLFRVAHNKVTMQMVSGAEPYDFRRTTAEKVKITVETAFQSMKTQWGRWVKVARDVAKKTPDEIIEMIISEDDRLPYRFSQVATGQLGVSVRDRMVPF